jgi:hypothetical protein
MGVGNSRAMTRLVLGIAAVTLSYAQSSEDPVDVLEQVRDKLIARLPREPRYSCVATIDRSYFSRKNPPLNPLSCERIYLDRKAGRNKLQLDKTDRLRLQVVLAAGHEIYSWTGPGIFSREVDEVLESGPAGTGEFGTYLADIFTNPAVQFRLLSQNENKLEYGFRVPIEASSFMTRGGTEWRKTGYAGSVIINPASLELKRLTLETGQLGPETSMCEAAGALDFPSGGAGMLLPSRSESYFVLSDTTEAERVTTFSDCQESPEKAFESLPELPARVRKDVRFELVFTTSIDTRTAAAGDVVTAKLAGLTPGIPSGATFTGRIMRMEHHLDKQGIARSGGGVGLRGRRYFLIWIVFDKMEVKGVVSSFHAQYYCSQCASIEGRKGEYAFVFPTEAANFAVPAGFTSKWVTKDGPPSK